VALWGADIVVLTDASFSIDTVSKDRHTVVPGGSATETCLSSHAIILQQLFPTERLQPLLCML